MSKKAKDEKPFNQSKYNYEWQKEKMLSISVRYNKEFVEEFRKALDKLELKQSEVIRKAMQEVIDQANNREI